MSSKVLRPDAEEMLTRVLRAERDRLIASAEASNGGGRLDALDIVRAYYEPDEKLIQLSLEAQARQAQIQRRNSALSLGVALLGIALLILAFVSLLAGKTDLNFFASNSYVVPVIFAVFGLAAGSIPIYLMRTWNRRDAGIQRLLYEQSRRRYDDLSNALQQGEATISERLNSDLALIEQMSDRGPLPSAALFLVRWGRIEREIVRLSASFAPDQRQPFGRQVGSLLEAGVLPEEVVDELRRLLRVRNALAHGGSASHSEIIRAVGRSALLLDELKKIETPTRESDSSD